MTEIKLKKSVHHRNQKQADINRDLFQKANLLTLNVLGSPGSGKTSLIEQTVQNLSSQFKILVVEGDIETERDADRIRALGIDAIQFQTHGACHLDAMMVAQSLQKTNLAELDLLIIENVGNLVCPANYDLGENLRIVVGSTTEGADKPLKYPEIFLKAAVCVVNKTDLLPYVSFDIEEFEAGARQTNQNIKIFRTSCTSTEGIEPWCQFLTNAATKTP